MAQLSGKSGFVKLGSVSYEFSKWSMDMKSGVPDVTNWGGGGYRELVPGILSATITISGPYDSTAMALTAGNSYVFHLGFDTGLEVSCTAIVSSIRPENDVMDAPRINVTAEQSGSFVASIV